MYSPLKRLEKMNSFTANESWKIFRLAAFAEAFGWTVLIAGVLINHFNLPGKTIAIPIAGQIHGTIFIAYFLITAFLYPSLKWSRIKTLFAFLSGVPPYGSLIFELFIAKKQTQEKELNKYVGLVLVKGHAVLAMQPSKGIEWILPRIPLKTNESVYDGAERLSNTFFGFILPFNSKPIKRGDTTYFKTKSNLDIDNLLECTKYLRNPYADEFAIYRDKEAADLLRLIDNN